MEEILKELSKKFNFQIVKLQEFEVMKNEFICDDRLDELKLNEDIRNMTDEEFEVFLEYVKKNDKYPDKYYMS